MAGGAFALSFATRGRPIFLVGTAHQNLERVIRQWPPHALTSSHGPRIQTLRSSSVVRITDIAFGCVGSTMACGAVVRKP